MMPREGWAREAAFLLAAVGLSLIPLGIPAAVGAFLLCLLLPGRALLRCVRPASTGEPSSSLVLSSGLSVAMTPLSLRLAGLVLGFSPLMVRGVLAGLTAALIGFGALQPRSGIAPVAGRPSVSRLAVVILVLTVVLLVPTLAIGPAADGGETRIKGWDLNNHLAIAEAITTRGLPPTNPFLATSSPFYYHTFFHILDAALLAVAGPRAPSYLLTVLLCLILCALFLSVFYHVVVEITLRPKAAEMALLFISLAGGYDLAPVLAKAFAASQVASLPALIVHHWNVDAWVSHRRFFIPCFFTQYYWAPHAVAGAIVLLLALYFLEKEVGKLGFLAAGICLASMAGFNGYIALGGAATVALLRGSALLGHFVPSMRHRRATLPRSALAGGTALLLASPVLGLYIGERGDVDKFRALRGGPLLPLQILVEFGPALLLGAAGMLLTWRKKELRKGTLAFLLMGAAALPMICFFASTGENNDLAMRVSMLVWISLAVFAGAALEQARRNRWRGIAALALVPGILGILWFVAGASIHKPSLPADEVAAGRWMRQHLPAGALIQGSPFRNTPDLVYLSGHPAVLSDSWAARLFYSEPADFDRNLAEIQEVFVSEQPKDACGRLQALGVAALVSGPPETSDFPALGGPLDWPCLHEGFRQGSYRVFLLRPPP